MIRKKNHSYLKVGHDVKNETTLHSDIISYHLFCKNSISNVTGMTLDIVVYGRM
jgi:hypothetical protein